MDRGVEIWLAWMFIDAPDSNNETPRLWHDTHTSLVFIGPHVIPVYNPRCSKLLHTRARRRGGGGGGVHSYTRAPPPLYTSFTERTYVRLCTYMFGVLTIPGPENLQGSIALPPDCARTSLTDTASEGRTLFLFSSLAGFSLRTAPSGNIGEYYFEKYASRLVLQDSRLASRVAN